MLNEEDKARIRAEEVSRLEEERSRLEETLKREAVVQYREEVARALQGKQKGRWGWGVALLILVGGAVVWGLLLPSGVQILESEEAAFVQRCQAEVSARVGPDWAFPQDDQIKAALVLSAEERSWQGFITREGRQQSFLCTSSAVRKDVRLELLGEESL